MDVNFFDDPGLAPKPREEVRIEDISTRLYADHKRVKVQIELTPFLPRDKPSLELTLLNADGHNVASLTVIEAMHRTMEFTLHIRQPDPEGEFTLSADLYYDEPSDPQHEVQTTFIIPSEEQS